MKNIFDGLRVIDFTTNIAGPFSTALLADYGAEIIKIEKPKRGDDSRGFAPQVEGVGVPFCWNNRGKKSLVLDMADPEALAIVKKLIPTADIVMESFKPGSMKKFGLDYDTVRAINPKIIYCSISGFGQTGPYAKKPGYDLIAQALSGAMDLTGEAGGPPTRIGIALGDYNAGIHALAGMLAALYHRERTGEGQQVDISLLDCLVGINGSMEIASIGKRPTRSGNQSASMAPFGVFQGNGGSLIICAPAPRSWTALCELMGRKDLIDDPQFNSNGARVKNAGQVMPLIEKWLKTFANTDEPFTLMDKAGIPCAKICSTNEVLANEQLLARGMITDIEMPDGVTVRTIKGRGNPLKFSAAKAVLKKAPALGQHEEEILKSIGYDDAAIATLKSRWGIA
jgi:Predicted acyl-CoA transferases/carnitine dehydratase